MTIARSSIGGVVIGVLGAMLIACGAGRASKSAPTSAAPAAMTGTAPASPRDRIDALDRQIDADLATLALARPAPAPTACIQPPCDAQAMAGAVAPQADPTCKPGPSDTCRDSCELSRSICSNADQICKIAGELGGQDAYANEKCASGTASCEASRARCCSCQI